MSCITPFKRDTQDLWETSNLLGTWSPKHSVVGQARWRHPCESIVSLGYVVMYNTQSRQPSSEQSNTICISTARLRDKTKHYCICI